MKFFIIFLLVFHGAASIANDGIIAIPSDMKATDIRRLENLRRMQGLASDNSRQFESTPDSIQDCQMGKHIVTKIDYPVQSRRNKEFGKVQLELNLNEMGCVLSAKISQSSNFPSLDNAVLNSIFRMKFAKRSNTGANNTAKFTYNFIIDEVEMSCISEYKSSNSDVLRNLAFLEAHMRAVDYCTKNNVNNLPPTLEFKDNKSESTMDIVKSIVGGDRQPPTNTSSQTNDFTNPLNFKPTASYADRIIRRIFPNIVHPGYLPDVAISCEIEVKTKPNGEIYERKILKSSGYQSWDTAVIKAVDKTASIPLDINGNVPSILILHFKSK